VVNVIKFRRILNFLLLTTLAVINTFLSAYKRKNRDNEADSSINNEAGGEVLCRNLNAVNTIQSTCRLDSHILIHEMGK
jgi:hypothetical protein